MKISVITATYNASTILPDLIASLRAQTDREFEWVVVDGLSADSTVDIVKSAQDLHPVVVSEKDFGIYDALNKGVGLSTGDYYVVIGADDTFDSHAIENFKNTLHQPSSLPDFVAASVLIGGKTVAPRSGLGWLYGMMGVASCHSVGLLIKKSLHDQYGLYSNKYPILADQFFVKTAYNQGASIYRAPFVSGRFSIEGLSATDHLGMLTEFFRVQVKTERFKSLQLLLFLMRLIKNINKIFT
ncbi:MAG: glycosyltransferase [Halopseudomonas sp.]